MKKNTRRPCEGIKSYRVFHGKPGLYPAVAYMPDATEQPVHELGGTYHENWGFSVMSRGYESDPDYLPDPEAGNAGIPWSYEDLISHMIHGGSVVHCRVKGTVDWEAEDELGDENEWFFIDLTPTEILQTDTIESHPIEWVDEQVKYVAAAWEGSDDVPKNVTQMLKDWEAYKNARA